MARTEWTPPRRGVSGSFMTAWDGIYPAPEDVDRHAVLELACRLYSRNIDLGARAVAHRAWEKHGGVSCDGALS